jgi:UDP-N-acetylglucosamine transferase subunit ALG13
MQYGTAAAPRHATGYDFLAHDELQDLIQSCDVLVTQGGPMGIVETRRTGRVPIAVPRLHRLGEVVDDHQVAFCRLLAAEDELVLAETEDQLRDALERAFDDLPAMRIPVTSTEEAVRAAVDRFGASVAELMQAGGSRGRWL